MLKRSRTRWLFFNATRATDVAECTALISVRLCVVGVSLNTQSWRRNHERKAAGWAFMVQPLVRRLSPSLVPG